MTPFYFQTEMTKPSGDYWTIGLELEAKNYTEALQIFEAWCYGVRAVSSLNPILRSFMDRPTPDRSYFNLDDAQTILAELRQTFIRNDGCIVPDPDMASTDPNNDCPF